MENWKLTRKQIVLTYERGEEQQVLPWLKEKEKVGAKRKKTGYKKTSKSAAFPSANEHWTKTEFNAMRYYLIDKNWSEAETANRLGRTTKAIISMRSRLMKRGEW